MNSNLKKINKNQSKDKEQITYTEEQIREIRTAMDMVTIRVQNSANCGRLSLDDRNALNCIRHFVNEQLSNLSK